MTDRKAELKAKLNDSRQILDTVFDQVGDRWDAQVYSDGLGWTVKQIAAHLVDAERGHLSQASNIAEGKDIIPEDFDIQRYNASRTQKNIDKTPEESRAALKEVRQEILAWLDNIEDEKLDRKGRHATLQIMTVHDILRLVSLHERGHAADIARTLDIKLV
jgi:uncharacterized damage-inducible protein DinB